MPWNAIVHKFYIQVSEITLSANYGFNGHQEVQFAMLKARTSF